jgi:hypothetical protein
MTATKITQEFLLRKEWRQYLKEIVPPGEHPAFTEDRRRTFYLGASAMLTVIMGHLRPGIMKMLSDELDLFLSELEEAQRSGGR